MGLSDDTTGKRGVLRQGGAEQCVPPIAREVGCSLYLNISNRCTLRCRFCPRFEDSSETLHGCGRPLPRLPATGEIIEAIGNPARYWEVVFCGLGEPTLRLRQVLEVADYVKSRNGRVRVHTDGLANRFHRRNVLAEMEGRVDAVSVSLNAQSAELYDYHCRPSIPYSFDSMLAFLSQATVRIPSVTATAIDGLQGVDMDACESLALRHGASFRRRTLDEFR